MTAKKDFKINNPAKKRPVADSFISTADAEEDKGESTYLQEKEAEIQRLKAEVSELKSKRETKSKRVNLLLKPSLVEKAKLEAKELDLSFNSFIEKLITDYFNNKEV